MSGLRRRGRSLLALVGAALALGSLWWHARAPQEPAPAPARDPTAQRAAEPLPPVPRDAPAFAPPDAPAEPIPSVAAAPRRAGDSLLDAAAPVHGGARESSPHPPPLSRVPHRVLHAWGGESEGEGRARGLTLVVDPALATSELERLARDALDRHAGAEVLRVEVFDSEEAATYDRHTDGGALAQRHLVASVSVHRTLGVLSLRVRGVELEP